MPAVFVIEQELQAFLKYGSITSNIYLRHIRNYVI